MEIGDDIRAGQFLEIDEIEHVDLEKESLESARRKEVRLNLISVSFRTPLLDGIPQHHKEKPIEFIFFYKTVTGASSDHIDPVFVTIGENHTPAVFNKFLNHLVTTMGSSCNSSIKNFLATHEIHCDSVIGGIPSMGISIKVIKNIEITRRENAASHLKAI